MISMLDEVRWENLITNFGHPPKENDLFFRLVAAYSEPHRHYHNAGHIEHCLGEFDSSRHLVEHPDTVELALWLHDVIYDPRSQDNEEQSARWAAEMLSSCGCTDAAISCIKDLILVTKHHDASQDPDARVLLDIDLSILGQPAHAYDQYERAVRAEYGWVPSPDYRIGRRKVLRSFAERPRIFQTVWFYELYEQAARNNLCRALAAL